MVTLLRWTTTRQRWACSKTTSPEIIFCLCASLFVPSKECSHREGVNPTPGVDVASSLQRQQVTGGSFPSPPQGWGFLYAILQKKKKKKCTCTSLLDIFSVQHFSRMQHETLFKSDKQGVFGKINRTISCVLYLWSAAFPWQLGAVGFNYHRSVKGPCSIGAGRGTAAAPPACPSLPHDCLQRARGPGQPAHQRAKTGVEQGNRGEAQSWPSLGEMTDDAHLPKPPPQSQGCSISEGDRRKEGLSAQR